MTSPRALVIFVAAAAASMACSSRSSDGATSPSPAPSASTPVTTTATAEVIVSAWYDGATLTVVRVAPDDGGPTAPAPIPGRPALTWSFVDAGGSGVASGSIADPTAATMEFAVDGTAAPSDASSAGLIELRLPALVGGGGTLQIAPVGGASSVPANPRVRPLDLTAPGAASAAVPAASTPEPSSGTAGLRKWVDHGACAPFNILLVSEGFQSSEMATFETVAEKIATGLSMYKGYAGSFQDFNVWILEVASEDSGITDPGCTPPGGNGFDACTQALPAVARNTAFGTHYGDNVTLPRRNITFGTGSPAAAAILASASRAARSDVIGFLANDPGNLSSGYGGSGDILGKRFITSTFDGVTASVVAVAAHESGHAFFGVQDEYSYGDTDALCATEAVVPTTMGRGPLPLVNVSPTSSSAPWASIQPAAPIAGGYYCKTAFSHPEPSCLMNTLAGPSGPNNDFCSVCLDHIASVIKTKEIFAACSCGASASADAGAADAGGLVTSGGALVCASPTALVAQGKAAAWWPF